MANNNNLINVPGYAQRVFYNDGIEYRNFTPDLVGNQTFDDSNGNTSLFTFGGFAIRTNTAGRVVNTYPTRNFSRYYSLNDLSSSTNVFVNAQDLISNDVKITLNIDNTKLNNFAYFGSATEFIRVSLESIITKWPASLYIRPITNPDTYSVENYYYDAYYDKSTFKIPTEVINNNFDIIYDTSGLILVNYTDELRNLTVNYQNYTVYYDNIEYPVIEYTGSTNTTNSYITLSVKGNPFNDNIGLPQYKTFHIKPNNFEIEKFFLKLEPFENNLLNRLTLPKYTSTFDYKVTTDSGDIYNTSKSITWPTSDGYNIDFNTTDYINYVTELLSISESSDELYSNLIVRFLTSESISNFDTVPTCDGNEEETAGQKMNKTLKVYGREYDEVKKYIDGIKFSNNVTYDKKNNTPDQTVKYLARVLGWELTNSVIDNNLLKTYLEVPQSTYSGQTRGLTAVEAEIELWRRLILNSAWLFKSKGTRKAIEFLFKFIGAPEGLINLNEHIYVAKSKIDIDLFTDLLIENGLDGDTNLYNTTLDGFPNPFPNTSGMYFQKGGLWYRETAGENATQYFLKGNNPHVGPYDGGYEYINQFRNLIPNFTPTVLTSSTYTTSVNELFTNYNNGLINNYTGDTYVDIETWSGVTLEDCFLYVADIINDPHPTSERTNCGCDVPTDDLSLYIDVKRNDYTQQEQIDNCGSRISGYTFIDSSTPSYPDQPLIYNWNYLQYNIDGTIKNDFNVSKFISPVCCQATVNGLSYLHDEYSVNPVNNRPTLINSGYVCCKPKGGSNETEGTGPAGKFNIKLYDTPDFNISFDNTVEIACGCFLSCQWRLAGPLLGHMYTYNNDIYLKYVTPKNNWGNDGQPEYRVSNQSDSCFCPKYLTTPSALTDPYTNKQGYGCKLTELGMEQLTLSLNDSTYGTTNSPIYQLFYKKSIGEKGCTSNI